MAHVHAFKVCVLGDGNVGKSALTIRYFQDQFVEDWDPTIEDIYNRKDILNGQMYNLEVQDTAGQQNYSALRDMYIRESQGFAIIFSVCEPTSFDNVESYYQNIRKHHGLETPILLIANKVDLTNMRRVTKEQVEEKATRLEIPYKETSAKTKYNVEEAFMHIVEKCLQQATNKNDEVTNLWNPEDPSSQAKKPEEKPKKKKKTFMKRIQKSCTIS